MSTAEIYRTTIAETRAYEFQANEVVYALSNKWLYKFKLAAKRDSPFELPIDNSLLLSHGVLKPGLLVPQDLVFVPADAWGALHGHYDGGPVIPVVCLPDASNRIIPAYNLRLFRVFPAPDSEPARVVVSDLDGVDHLRALACDALKTGPPDRARLRRYWQETIGDIIPDTGRIADLHLFYGQPLLLEVRGSDGSWPTHRRAARAPGSDQLRIAGVCGLSNPRNLCYANSVFQCLLHTGALRRFFADGANGMVFPDRTVPGIVADKFRRYWQSSGITLDLSELTRRLGSAFATGQQQDAHDFLSRLLNRLFYDMSLTGSARDEHRAFRGDGTNDDELAAELWQFMIRKYDTPIFELFTGIRRTRVKCEECGHVETLIDPIESLTLTFSQARKQREIVVIRGLGERGICTTITFRRKATLLEYEQAVIAAAKLDRADRIIFTSASTYLPIDVSAIPADFPIVALVVPDVSAKYVIVSGGAAFVPFVVPVGNAPDRFPATINDTLKGLGIQVTFRQPPPAELLPDPIYPWLFDPVINVTIHIERPDVDVMRFTAVDILPGPDIWEPIAGHLAEFCAGMRWTADDHRRCEHCQMIGSGSSAVAICRLPKILVLHIAKTAAIGLDEIPVPVEYPNRLDMGPYALDAEGQIYELFGVVDHLGRSLDHGHYVAHVKHQPANKWIMFDDTQFREFKSHHTRNAYLLFYERVET